MKRLQASRVSPKRTIPPAGREPSSDSGDPPPRPGDVRATVVIDLGVDGGGRPVGTARFADGTTSTFVGWLGLMAELSGLLSKEAR